jgi:RNA polymerase sigma factor (sigma-70 family)
MKDEWDLSQDDFDRLLAWLDTDRELAGQKYENLRRGLIDFFNYRGCSGAEDLADDTINRVTRKVKELEPKYKGDPVRYFYGVAKKVCQEYLRKKPTLEITSLASYTSDQADILEQQDRCLAWCINQLSPVNREVILTYYQKDKREKIDARKELGKRLGLTSNTLRVRASRIREALEKCVLSCLEQEETRRNETS